MKAEKLKIDHWRDKESTRDAVRIAIRDFLWSDKTGLPVDSYTEDDFDFCTVLKDPSDEEYERLMEWSGGNYDSEKFDSDTVEIYALVPGQVAKPGMD